MQILGIETSCDDTGLAVLQITGKKNPKFKILSNMVSSQIKIHQQYGGVYPMLAKRAHEKNLPIVLKKALSKAGFSLQNPNIDAIAFTIGPGLAPCLWAGLNFTRELAQKWNVSLIPVDHIEGHLLVALLHQNNKKTRSTIPNYHIQNTKNVFPAIALIVSGGHTQLVLVKGIGDYKIIGETRDDAAGEAFDKTARILGLEFPGGPAIAREAASFASTLFPQAMKDKAKSKISFSELHLPRPMIHTKDYDFSFSGLKTAVLYDYQARTKKERESKEYISAMAAEIQQAIVDVLIHKTLRATQEYNTKSVILGGGVAANDELRKQLLSAIKTTHRTLHFLVPPKSLSTDNGTMIALAGYFNMFKKQKPADLSTLEAKPNLRIE